MGKGSVMKAYDVTADSQLWSGIENCNILVKLYMVKRHKGKLAGDGIKNIPSMMKTAIESYKKAEQLLIPQAILYNVDTAIEDCCFIVEKISGQLDINCVEQMEQVKKLFKTYFEKNIVLDLGPANLCVKTDESKKETVVLVDYMETDQDHRRGPFFEDVLGRWYTAIKAKCSDLSDEERKIYAIALIKDLTEGLEEYGFDPQSINKLW
jgi:hypothetical protein